MIWQSGLLGVTEEYFEVRERRLAEGRLFDNYDIETMAKVVMRGATPAEHIFKEADPRARQRLPQPPRWVA